MNYDAIVVGTGIAGSVLARELAEQGKEVLILERRNHIGGNCYDEKDQFGILIHTYGPHIFHTNKEAVYQYLSKYTKWYEFGHEVVANVHGKLIPVPFNLNTLHIVYDEEKANQLEKKLVEAYGMESRVPILELRKSLDPDIAGIASYVYENIFLKYTMKQWGQKPEEIDPAVTGRVPVVISHDNRYFQEPYQGMPLDGYTKMFENILSHEKIHVETGKDAKTVLNIDEKSGTIFYLGEPYKGIVVYTGALDELFDCKLGKLPYRSLRFVFEHYDREDYQGHSVINYTVDQEYTRITEFKYLTGQKSKDTTIVKEYPFAYTGAKGEIPYYAISNDANQNLYSQYVKLTEKIPNLYLLGRLAEYKYYNIDAMTEKALELAKMLEER